MRCSEPLRLWLSLGSLGDSDASSKAEFMNAIICSTKLCLWLFLTFGLTAIAHANGHIKTHKDETSGTVALVIAIAGFLVTVLGVFVVLRGKRGSSDLHVQLGEHKRLRLTALTQGVLIVLFGVIILVVGLYKLPRSTSSEEIDAKEIRKEKDGTLIMKK